MKQVIATVISNVELMPGVHLLKVNAPEIASIAKPGQFVMVNSGPNVVLRRPFSIHLVKDSKDIYLLFAVLVHFEGVAPPATHREVETRAIKGEGTLWLSNHKPGEKLDLLGPLGNGFSIVPESKKLLLVAGGIGIAPLAFLANQALCLGKQVTLLLGARTVAGLYPKDHLPREIKTVLITEEKAADKSKYRQGILSEIFAEFTEGADQAFACGPFLMYKAIFDLMQQMAWQKPVQVSLETRMGCGIGTCYSCSIKTTSGMKTVCHDGPVFDMREIIWAEVKI